MVTPCVVIDHVVVSSITHRRALLLEGANGAWRARQRFWLTNVAGKGDIDEIGGIGRPKVEGPALQGGLVARQDRVADADDCVVARGACDLGPCTCVGCVVGDLAIVQEQGPCQSLGCATAIRGPARRAPVWITF